MTRRELLLAATRAGIVSAVAGLAQACQGWPRPPVSSYRPPSPSPTPKGFSAAIGLPSEPSIDNLPLLHLVQSGYLRDQGIDLSVVWGQAGYEPLAGLIAGKTAFALLDVPTAAEAAERKVDLVGIFLLYSGDSSRVIALERSGIRAATDLKGRRVGLRSQQGAAPAALRACLRVAGLDTSDVEQVTAQVGLRQLLEGSQVAALSTSVHLVPWFEARSLPVTLLPPGGWQIVPGQAIVTTRSFVPDNRAELKRLALSLRDGVLAILDNPSGLQTAARVALAPEADQRPALAAQVESVVASLREFPTGRGPGWADADHFEAAANYLRDLGALRGSVNLTQVFINDFLPRPTAG